MGFNAIPHNFVVNDLLYKNIKYIISTLWYFYTLVVLNKCQKAMVMTP